MVFLNHSSSFSSPPVSWLKWNVFFLHKHLFYKSISNSFRLFVATLVPADHCWVFHINFEMFWELLIETSDDSSLIHNSVPVFYWVTFWPHWLVLVSCSHPLTSLSISIATHVLCVPMLRCVSLMLLLFAPFTSLSVAKFLFPAQCPDYVPSPPP